MFADTENDNGNNIKGVAVTVGVHVLLLLLCFWMFVFKAPNPPLPKYGEIRLGFDPNGLGDSYDPASSTTTPQETFTPVEANSEPTPEAVEEVTASANSNAVSLNEEKKKSEKKTEKRTTTATNPSSVYNPDRGTNNPGGGNGTPGGTQGNPNGVYGGAGQGGVGLNMAGWAWDSEPNTRDISQEAGKVVLKVIVDEKGEILDVDIVETTVNKSLANKYRLKVMNMTFSKTDGGLAPSRSEGIITFTIKAR